MLLAISAAAGCGKSPYELAPVRGTVMIAGKPFTQGKVQFAPSAAPGSVNAGKPAFATVQADGSFVLTTYKEGDGAVVGTHSVTLINVSNESAPPLPADVPKFSRVTVPRKFPVEAGQENNIKIELSIAEVTKYRQLD